MTGYTLVNARALVESAITRTCHGMFYPYVWSVYRHPNGSYWLEVANSRTGKRNSFLLDEDELNELDGLVNYIARKAVALRDNLNREQKKSTARHFLDALCNERGE